MRNQNQPLPVALIPEATFRDSVIETARRSARFGARQIVPINGGRYYTMLAEAKGLVVARHYNYSLKEVWILAGAARILLGGDPEFQGLVAYANPFRLPGSNNSEVRLYIR